MITNAMAREIIVGKDGKAEAVSYLDKKTRTEKRVRAKAVMVSASACESARLLLNSKSSLFPDGLANSSGVVGRNLMDSVGSDGVGYFPQMEKIPPHNHDGVGGMHVYVPWWKFDRKNDFHADSHRNLGRPLYARCRYVSRNVRRRRRLRRISETDLSQAVRHPDRFCGTR